MRVDFVSAFLVPAVLVSISPHPCRANPFAAADGDRVAACAESAGNADPLLQGTVDCNSNGIDDAQDVAGVTSTDCNTNGTPDECDIAAGTASDCDGSGTLDECELSLSVVTYDASLGVLPSAASPPWSDLGGFPGAITSDGLLVIDDDSGSLLGYYEVSGVFDSPSESAICEFTGRAISGSRPTGQKIVWASGISDGAKYIELTVLVDRIGFLATANNFVPGCAANLVTTNGLHTFRIVKLGQSQVDVYADDELAFSCPYASLPAGPANRVLLLATSSIGRSKFELASLSYAIDSISLTSTDCNTNGVPDACDIEGGTSADCNLDGTPDDCQLEGDDCNANGMPDTCELAPSFSLLETDFETGMPAGWTATSLWHVTDQCVHAGAPDPSKWAYFGLDAGCHFNTGGTVAGAITAPSFEIPANAVSASLSYASIYDGDRGSAAVPYGFDRAWVQVNGQVVDDVGPTPALGAWETRQVDLSAFIGQTVTVSWKFDSIDAVSNGRLGWQVDAIRLLATTNNDCNSNGLPDDCEDCNTNTFADSCDIASGTSPDCDSNGVPDECDVVALDCNSNGVPDPCDPDFDGDGLTDDCDSDVDGDGVSNAFDACGSSGLAEQVNPYGGPMGDLDDDCEVTLVDYYYFDICLYLSGPGGDPVFQDCRDVFDFDGDGDVDLRDFAELELRFGGGV